MYDQACAAIPGTQSAIFCFPDISGKFKFCQKLNSDWSISETTPSIHEHRMSQNLGRLGQLLISVGGASNSMVEYFDGKTWTDQAWVSNLFKILQKKVRKIHSKTKLKDHLNFSLEDTNHIQLQLFEMSFFYLVWKSLKFIDY